VTTDYTRTLNIDEPLAYERSNGTIRYYVLDALGSVVALTDANGAVTTSYAYDAFGNVTISGSDYNPFQYTGRENDGMGLYYYRARYYSPQMRRFVSEDPIRLWGGMNFYGYVKNSPLNWVDPIGLTGKHGETEYFWGDCNNAEVSECKAICESQGKQYGSCKWKYSYRTTIRNGKSVRALYKLPNGMSCSCEDTDDNKIPSCSPIPDIPPLIVPPTPLGNRRGFTPQQGAGFALGMGIGALAIMIMFAPLGI
jgi:RHS repeat-associated protein